MPNKLFLETYPLYRKFKMVLPETLDRVGTPAIHMFCKEEDSSQTFNAVAACNADYSFLNVPTCGTVIRLVYSCNSCKNFSRYFFIKFDNEGKFVMKVGQEPPWEITPDPQLAKVLGTRLEYYEKALVCESQSYGIAAFAYYRRIVEEIIDDLLGGVMSLLNDTEKSTYAEALEKVNKTIVTQEKIQLVKDMLPPILRPDGMNPLSNLHEALSEGLHANSDDRCMELAETLRDVLIFLVTQIAITGTAAATFTENMRRLLERKKI